MQRIEQVHYTGTMASVGKKDFKISDLRAIAVRFGLNDMGKKQEILDRISIAIEEAAAAPAEKEQKPAKVERTEKEQKQFAEQMAAIQAKKPAKKVVKDVSSDSEEDVFS